MQYLIAVFLLTGFLVSHPVTAEPVSGPTQEATRFIEEFGLPEGQTACGALPSSPWKT